jgi:hypothetical protein
LLPEYALPVWMGATMTPAALEAIREKYGNGEFVNVLDLFEHIDALREALAKTTNALEWVADTKEAFALIEANRRALGDQP